MSEIASFVGETFGIAQFAQGFNLDLANALAGKLKYRTHVVKAMIVTVTQTVAHFNGTITNDKFCMSRIGQLQPLSARKLVTQEVNFSSGASEVKNCPQEEDHETTAVERSALQHRDSRRSSQVGSSLPVPCPMECSISESKTTSEGEQR